MKTATLNIIKNEKGETLFLLRAKKPFGWGLVGGKLDEGETDEEACIRETKEETGIELETSQLRLVGNAVSVYGTPLTIYETILDHTPAVKFNKGEHLNFKWFVTHTNNYKQNYTDDVRSKHFAGRTLEIIDMEKEQFIPEFLFR